MGFPDPLMANLLEFTFFAMKENSYDKKDLLELLKNIVSDLEAHDLPVRPALLERIKQLEEELEKPAAE